MSIKLVFTAHRRPEYLKKSLESWSQVRGIKDLKIDVFLDLGDKQAEMLEVMENSSLCIEAHVNTERLGVLNNPWHALDHSFDNGSDFTIIAEEDILVSDDILDYFNAATSMYSADEVLGVCAHTYASFGDPCELKLESRFEVLVWGTWKQSWEQHIRNTWDHDYSTGLSNGSEAGWDWNLSRVSKVTKPFVHPGVSRSQHIGEQEGAHTTPQMYSETLAPTFLQHRQTAVFYT
jgi:hypothetical protein